MWTDSQAQVFPIAIMVVLAIGITVGILLRNKDERLKLIPIKIIASLMILSEVVKIIRAIVLGIFTKYYFPFHLSSTFMLWYALAGFAKGRAQKVGKVIGVTGGLAATIGLIIYPNPIIGSACEHLSLTWANYDEWSSFYYHWCMGLCPIIMLASNLVEPKMKDLKYLFLGIYPWMLITTIFANVLDFNYANLLYSDLPFLQNILEEQGYALYLALLYLGFFIIGVVLQAVLIGVTRLVHAIIKRFSKNDTVEKQAIALAVENYVKSKDLDNSTGDYTQNADLASIPVSETSPDEP